MDPFVSYGNLTAKKRPGRVSPWVAENSERYRRREQWRKAAHKYYEAHRP
jgi:hypothetical protein